MPKIKMSSFQEGFLNSRRPRGGAGQMYACMVRAVARKGYIGRGEAQRRVPGAVQRVGAWRNDSELLLRLQMRLPGPLRKGRERLVTRPRL